LQTLQSSLSNGYHYNISILARPSDIATSQKSLIETGKKNICVQRDGEKENPPGFERKPPLAVGCGYFSQTALLQREALSRRKQQKNLVQNCRDWMMPLLGGPCWSWSEQG
jgi:hypothetical protein